MSTTLDPVEFYAAQFERTAPIARASEPEWMTRTRRNAVQSFRQLGFPTTQDEEWRFTNVRPIVETEFDLVGGPAAECDASLLDRYRLPGASAELVFVNGRHAPGLSRSDARRNEGRNGVWVGSLSAALASRPGDVEPYLAQAADVARQGFTALNTAFWTDGALVRIAAGTAVTAPVHIMFVTTNPRGEAIGAPARSHGGPPAAHPRVLIVAGDDSQASIVESYVGPGDGLYLTNAITEALIGDHAVVEHYKIQSESKGSYHIATLAMIGAAHATFTSHSADLGGGIVRNAVTAVLDGEGAECTLNGLYLVDGDRLVDNHTTIDHARPHCSSRELYKGILADRARGVFNGKIVVRPDAQKTDAKQTNKALLLSQDAQINTKPQLEIFANDVKCTHGAAVGQLDEDALFYLRARGLPITEARRLLVQAFAGEVLNRMTFAPLRGRMEAELLQRLAVAGVRT